MQPAANDEINGLGNRQEEGTPVNVDGVLKFLHHYDPQNENEDTARAFHEFLVTHRLKLAAGGDGIVKELYAQFKEQRNQ